MSRGFQRGRSSFRAGESPAGKINLPDLVPDEQPKEGRPAEAVALAEDIRSRSAVLEKTLTPSLVAIAAKFGAKMQGLQWRLKTTESLARKIADDARKEYNGDFNKAASKISDAVRYTAEFTDDKYTEGVANMLEALKAEGWDIGVKNFWKEGDPYQGINVKITKDGTTSELQFHTPKSFHVKEKVNHEKYKEFREIVDLNDPRKRQLWTEMIEAAKNIPRPSGYEKLLALGILAIQTYG